MHIHLSFKSSVPSHPSLNPLHCQLVCGETFRTYAPGLQSIWIDFHKGKEFLDKLRAYSFARNTRLHEARQYLLSQRGSIKGSGTYTKLSKLSAHKHLNFRSNTTVMVRIISLSYVRQSLFGL